MAAAPARKSGNRRGRPLLHLSPQDRERVWSLVADRFRALHRAKFNQTAYVHNQFMIYLVAVRND